jgi:hypothetical protein
MEECVRMMQQTLRSSPSIKKRAKSVYSQRNLGTIKDRKREKKEEKEISGGETILRILRMRYVLSTRITAYHRMPTLTLLSRPNTSDFIAQQLQILATMQAEQEQRERQQQKRKAQRPGGAARIPEVPAVPEIPPGPLQ